MFLPPLFSFDFMKEGEGYYSVTRVDLDHLWGMDMKRTVTHAQRNSAVGDAVWGNA